VEEISQGAVAEISEGAAADEIPQGVAVAEVPEGVAAGAAGAVSPRRGVVGEEEGEDAHGRGRLRRARRRPG